MGERQSPAELLDAMFSHVRAADAPDFTFVPSAAHSFLGALNALHVLGLISDDEQRHWRAELDSEAQRIVKSPRAQEMRERMIEWSRQGPPVWDQPQAKQAALELLAREGSGIRQLREAVRAMGAGSPSTDRLSRGYGAIEALHAVGLLDNDERKDWNTRLAQIAIETMPVPTRVIQPPTVRPSSITARRISAREEPVSAPRVQPHMPEFRGEGTPTLIVVSDDQRSRDEPCLDRVELYDDGIIIEWTRPWAREPGAMPPDMPRLRLHDDLGNEYLNRGGGGRGVGALMRQHTVFVPAVAPEATMLDVQIEDALWRIPINA